MSVVIDKISDLLNETAGKLNVEIVEATYGKTSEGMTLDVYIYKPEGISLEDCEAFSREIDEPLEALNPTNDEAYTLNISSPGLDRPLKTEKDFLRNIGEILDIKLYVPLAGNKKEFSGKLITSNQDEITVLVVKKEIVLNYNQIAKCTLHIKF